MCEAHDGCPSFDMTLNSVDIDRQRPARDRRRTMMNWLREARLVTAAMMIGVALAGAGRADDAKTKATTKPDTAAAAAEQAWEGKLSIGAGLSLPHRRARRQDVRGQADGQDGQPRPRRQGAEGRYDHPRQDDPVLRDEGAAGQVRGQAERRRDRGGRYVDPGGQQPSADLEEDR